MVTPIHQQKTDLVDLCINDMYDHGDECLFLNELCTDEQGVISEDSMDIWKHSGTDVMNALDVIESLPDDTKDVTPINQEVAYSSDLQVRRGKVPKRKHDGYVSFEYHKYRELTKNDIHSLARLFTVNESAKYLRIGVTTLKKICRKVGVQRWPGRKYQILRSIIKIKLQEIRDNEMRDAKLRNDKLA